MGIVSKSTKFSCIISVFIMLMIATGCSSQMPAPTTNLTTPAVSTPAVSGPKPAPTQVALLVPLKDGLANAGKAIQAGFDESYKASSIKPAIKVYDTSEGSITDVYKKAIDEGANYVVGPLDKQKVAQIAKNSDIKAVTIALNDSESGDAPQKIISDFYQFPLSPTQEAQQVAQRAASAGHRAALLITPAGKWGQDIGSALQTQWQANGGTVVGSLEVDTDQNLKNKMQELLKVRGQSYRQDFDVIFLIARPSLARQIKPLLNYYRVNRIPVFSTSLIYSGLLDTEKDKDLDGVIFCDEPLVLAKEGPWADLRQQLTLSQPIFVQQYIRLFGLGYDAAGLTQNFNNINSGVNGATGELSLSSDQHIVRKLKWAIFQKGIPNELP